MAAGNIHHAGLAIQRIILLSMNFGFSHLYHKSLPRYNFKANLLFYTLLKSLLLLMVREALGTERFLKSQQMIKHAQTYKHLT